MTDADSGEVVKAAAPGVMRPGSPKVAVSAANARSSRWDHEYTFGHTVLFMEQYHRGAMDILRRLKGELALIGELTSRAASVIRNGGTVWTSMTEGHMPHSEHSETRRGCPGIMKDHTRDEFDRLKKGDMVFTNFCKPGVLAARERGVYVVCVTVNYTNNEYRPPWFTAEKHRHPDGLVLRDVSDVILHSHLPYWGGLVRAPEIPELALCQSTTTGSGAVHWMLNAEITSKLANEQAKAIDKSAEYLRVLTERVERVAGHMDRIREAAVTMAHRIRAGGRWFVRSLEHPGLASELHGIASGPRMVNWGDWDATKQQNVMLIGAISPAHRPEVELAREKQLEGAYVIAIGPAALDGEVPPGRLIDVADAGFDSLSPESGGVIRVSGREETICPTSGIVANVIQQMLCAQWVDEMVRRGSVPYFYMGHYQEGGFAYNDGVKPFFELQGF